MHCGGLGVICVIRHGHTVDASFFRWFDGKLVRFNVTNCGCQTQCIDVLDVQLQQLNICSRVCDSTI